MSQGIQYKLVGESATCENFVEEAQTIFSEWMSLPVFTQIEILSRLGSTSKKNPIFSISELEISKEKFATSGKITINLNKGKSCDDQISLTVLELNQEGLALNQDIDRQLHGAVSETFTEEATKKHVGVKINEEDLDYTNCDSARLKIAAWMHQKLSEHKIPQEVYRRFLAEMDRALVSPTNKVGSGRLEAAA